MHLKVAKHKFPAPQETDYRIKELNQRVHFYLRHQAPDLRWWLIFKAVILALAFTGGLALILNGGSGLLFIGYPLAGLSLLLAGFNFAHDAAHNALFKSRRLNALAFEFIFNLQGASGYLWKIRHIHSHHPFPNLEHCDADMELNSLIRLSHSQPLRGYHRFQHLYAPFLYSIYSLFWIFYKDPVLLFRQKQGNLFITQISLLEKMKFFLYKSVYLGFFLFLPVYLHGIIAAGAFLFMHLLVSLFMLFTFIISHHVEETRIDGDRPLPRALHQVATAADFHPRRRWANFIFGGFNTHVAHHLFPRVPNAHYPRISRIIQKQLKKAGVEYHCFSYGQGICSHLRLLRRMGSRR